MAGRHYTPLGYCDQTDVEDFLLLTIDSSFSQQVDDWIATAEKQVNNYLGYTTASGILRENITAETSRSYVDTEGNLVLFPQKIPIVSVSSISLVKGTESLDLTLTDSSGNTRYNVPTSADHILYPAAELSMTGSSIIRSFAEIRNTKFLSKINYIAGYAETPADIRQATINLVADIVMRHSNKEGLQSITQGRISKSYMSREGASDFYLDAVTLLEPYKIASLWL